MEEEEGRLEPMFERVCLKILNSSVVGEQIMEVEVGNDGERSSVVESQRS